jgi:hypothetical protein
MSLDLGAVAAERPDEYQERFNAAERQYVLTHDEEERIVRDILLPGGGARASVAPARLGYLAAKFEQYGEHFTDTITISDADYQEMCRRAGENELHHSWVLPATFTTTFFRLGPEGVEPDDPTCERRMMELLMGRHAWSDGAEFNRLANAFWYGASTYAARAWQLRAARQGGRLMIESFELPGTINGVHLSRNLDLSYTMVTGNTVTLFRAYERTAVIIYTGARKRLQRKFKWVALPREHQSAFAAWGFTEVISQDEWLRRQSFGQDASSAPTPPSVQPTAGGGHLQLDREGRASIEEVPMQIFGHQVMVGDKITEEMFLEWFEWGEEMGLSEDEIMNRITKLMQRRVSNPT